MGDFNLDDYIAAIPEGKGNLNKNGQKKVDIHPDYRGYLRLNGIVYEIGGWIKQTKDGKPKMNLSVKPFVPKPAQQPQSSYQPKARYQDDNDIPF